MNRVDGIRPLESTTEVTHVGLEVLPDVFSQKLGDWAFSQTVPAKHNGTIDIPSAFSIKPVDNLVMDYLEEFVGQAKSLPMGHLYDGALDRLYHQIDDANIKELLQQDIELRDYLRAKKVGEFYE